MTTAAVGIGEPLGETVMIRVHLTQSDLAAMVGATRARVNQVLAYYRRHGYITIDQTARITVLQHEALETRAR